MIANIFSWIIRFKRQITAFTAQQCVFNNLMCLTDTIYVSLRNSIIDKNTRKAKGIDRVGQRDAGISIWDLLGMLIEIKGVVFWS